MGEGTKIDSKFFEDSEDETTDLNKENSKSSKGKKPKGKEKTEENKDSPESLPEEGHGVNNGDSKISGAEDHQGTNGKSHRAKKPETSVETYAIGRREDSAEIKNDKTGKNKSSAQGVLGAKGTSTILNSKNSKNIEKSKSGAKYGDKAASKSLSQRGRSSSDSKRKLNWTQDFTEDPGLIDLKPVETLHGASFERTSGVGQTGNDEAGSFSAPSAEYANIIKFYNILVNSFQKFAALMSEQQTLSHAHITSTRNYLDNAVADLARVRKQLENGSDISIQEAFVDILDDTKIYTTKIKNSCFPPEAAEILRNQVKQPILDLFKVENKDKVIRLMDARIRGRRHVSQKSEKPLFGPSGKPEVEDVKQMRGVSECYFIAPLRAIVNTDPDSIYRCFPHDLQADAQKIGVRLHKIAFRKSNSSCYFYSTGNVVVAVDRSPLDASDASRVLWPQILKKAILAYIVKYKPFNQMELALGESNVTSFLEGLNRSQRPEGKLGTIEYADGPYVPYVIFALIRGKSERINLKEILEGSLKNMEGATVTSKPDIRPPADSGILQAHVYSWVGTRYGKIVLSDPLAEDNANREILLSVEDFYKYFNYGSK